MGCLPLQAGQNRKKNLWDPGFPIVAGPAPGCPNTILAKGNNPEMNVNEGLTHSLKDHGWGLFTPFLGTPENF